MWSIVDRNIIMWCIHVFLSEQKVVVLACMLLQAAVMGLYMYHHVAVSYTAPD
jgi:hypothetical protein